MVKNPNHDKVLVILRDLVNSAISIGDAHKLLLDEFGREQEVLMGAEEAQLPETRGPIELSEYKGPESDPVVEAANTDSEETKEEAPKPRRGRKAKGTSGEDDK